LVWKALQLLVVVAATVVAATAAAWPYRQALAGSSRWLVPVRSGKALAVVAQLAMTGQ